MAGLREERAGPREERAGPREDRPALREERAGLPEEPTGPREEPAGPREEWDELLAAALLGTERRAERDPRAVLDRAAVLTAARRAGRLAGHAAPPPPSGADHRPAVGQAAGRRLGRMLRGTRSDLIPEWLRAATARGKRPPDHLLPALLGLARSSPSARALVVGAGGPRARWLADLNEDWAFAEFITADDTQRWRLGAQAERLAYLTAVRRTDPERARGIVEEAWQTAAAAERAQFLAVLADRLSPADEPLLERSLDDRAGQVRDQAASLLARLVDSAFAARMTQRSADMVRVGPGRITVHLPAARDAAMERDHVRGPADLVAATPLGAWPPPEQTLALPAGEWEDLLLTGWARAAIAQRDQAWIDALVGHLLGSRPPARHVHTLRELLGSVGVPWPRNLTEQVLRRGATADILAMAAHRGDPALGSGAAADDAPELLRVLRFRHDMLKELDD